LIYQDIIEKLSPDLGTTDSHSDKAIIEEQVKIY